MENHPIPQDVTGFKFKLVGSITLKEFFYILGGGIVAVIIFLIPQPALIFRLPFMVLFGGSGAILAFIPIEGRPFDKMLYNFIKTVPSENEYIYRKKGIDIRALEYFKPLKAAQTPAAQEKAQNSTDIARRNLFYAQLKHSTYKVDSDELALLQNVKSYFDDANTSLQKPSQTQAISIKTQPVSIPTSAHSANATATVTPPHTIRAQHTENVSLPIASIQPQPDAPHPTPEVAQNLNRKVVNTDSLHPVIGGLGTQTIPTNNTSVQLGNIPNTPFHISQDELTQATIREVKEHETLNAASATQGDEFQFRQKPITQATAPTTQATPVSNQQAQIRAGFPHLPDKPNIILGIVRDPRSKVLPQILVEVLDSNGLSVRAFKTNALGQFASATPLPNGNYSILLNDQTGKQQFQTIPIKLTGEIFQPVEIISIDAREKLRQELFGSNSVASS